MEFPVSLPRERMSATCFTSLVFLKHSSPGHNVHRKTREAEELFMHKCKSQGHHILSKYGLTSIMIAQAVTSNPDGSPQMVFWHYCLRQNHSNSLDRLIRGHDVKCYCLDDRQECPLLCTLTPPGSNKEVLLCTPLQAVVILSYFHVFGAL